MPHIVFDPKISWGHVMQAILLVIGLSAGYHQLKADDRLLAREIEESQERFASLLEVAKVRSEAKIDANSARIDAQGEVIRAQLEAIADGLKGLRETIKELRDNQEKT